MLQCSYFYESWYQYDGLCLGKTLYETFSEKSSNFPFYITNNLKFQKETITISDLEKCITNRPFQSIRKIFLFESDWKVCFSFCGLGLSFWMDGLTLRGQTSMFSWLELFLYFFSRGHIRVNTWPQGKIALV